MEVLWVFKQQVGVVLEVRLLLRLLPTVQPVFMVAAEEALQLPLVRQLPVLVEVVSVEVPEEALVLVLLPLVLCQLEVSEGQLLLLLLAEVELAVLLLVQLVRLVHLA